ncbi:hypothetical protein Tco_1404573 [Tanacetum coccineum]
MFDELLTPPSSVDYPASEVVASIHEVAAQSPALGRRLERGYSKETEGRVVARGLPSRRGNVIFEEVLVLRNTISDSCDTSGYFLMVDKFQNWNEDKVGKAVVQSQYRGMIDSLLYITSARPDLLFVIKQCVPDTRRSTSGSMQFLGDGLLALVIKKRPGKRCVDIQLRR